MKKKVLVIVIILATVVGIFAFRSSFAWFGAPTDKRQEIDFGALKYSFSGQLMAVYTDEDEIDYAAPGENMIHVDGEPGTLTAFNKSTIDTNIRVRVDYTYYNVPTSSFVTVTYGDQTNDFSVIFANPGKWNYDAASKCWLYADTMPAAEPPETTEESTEETTAETTTEFLGDVLPLITSLGYADSIVAGSVYENQPVTVKLVVEVKQADYVNWTTVITDVYG